MQTTLQSQTASHVSPLGQGSSRGAKRGWGPDHLDQEPLVRTLACSENELRLHFRILAQEWCEHPIF